MKSLLVLLLCLVASVAAARGLATRRALAGLPGLTGSLSGVVLDSTTHQPVAYATVVLLPAAPASEPITGVTGDDQGHFLLPQLPTGSFRVQVSFVGYATRIHPVTVTDGPTTLPTIWLPPAAQQLGEALVVGSKPVVDIQPDRLVYNAGADVTNTGGNAADVLRKTPLLAVDGDGNVTMRGSSNFKVLINSKPSPTLAQNLADALKSIPADQIQSVEVITTPPARYDGEGTAGIINIILKHGVSQGVSGLVGITTGNRINSVTAALSFKKGKVGFTSSATASRWNSLAHFNRTRLGFLSLGTDTLRQHRDLRNAGNSYNATIGLDFEATEHDIFSLTSSLNGFVGHSRQDIINRFTSPDANQNQLFSRYNDNIFGRLNLETTGTYSHTFVQPRREWSVLGQYALSNGNSGYDFNQFDGSGVLLEAGQATYREHSRSRTPSHEITAQTDFVQPVGAKATLELGLKTIFRRNSSLAAIDTLFPALSSAFAPSRRRTVDFGYAQNVQAAYAIYSFGLGPKFTASLGSRLEHTTLTATFRASDTGFTSSYSSLLPAGNARYAVSETSGLRLAYSRRITRPSIDFLNPYVNQGDAKNIWYGNPALNPELTDSYELSYNATIKMAAFNVSASVRHTGNAIEQVRFATTSPLVPLPPTVPVDASVTVQTFANVAANTFYQLNFFGSVKPAPSWEVSGGPDIQYITRQSAALNAMRRGFTAGLTFNTSYKLPKGLTLQSSLNGSSRPTQIQGLGPAILFYSFGVKKTVLQDKADVTLNVSSLFNDNWPYHITIITAAFEERSEYRNYDRSFRLSFNYHFGQQQQSRQRKQITNDENKSGASSPGNG